MVQMRMAHHHHQKRLLMHRYLLVRFLAHTTMARRSGSQHFAPPHHTNCLPLAIPRSHSLFQIDTNHTNQTNQTNQDEYRDDAFWAQFSAIAATYQITSTISRQNEAQWGERAVPETFDAVHRPLQVALLDFSGWFQMGCISSDYNIVTKVGFCWIGPRSAAPHQQLIEI